jgi:hypothetical protein
MYDIVGVFWICCDMYVILCFVCVGMFSFSSFFVLRAYACVTGSERMEMRTRLFASVCAIEKHTFSPLMFTLTLSLSRILSLYSHTRTRSLDHCLVACACGDWVCSLFWFLLHHLLLLLLLLLLFFDREKWLKNFGTEYQTWLQSLQLTEKQRKKALKSVLEGSEKARAHLLEKASQEVLDSVPSAAVTASEGAASSVAVSKAYRAQDIAVAVEQSLKSFRGALIYRVDAGRFSVAIGKKQESPDTQLSTISFEGLQAFVSNTSTLQSMYLSLDTMDVSGLNHPTTPASLEVCSLLTSVQLSKFVLSVSLYVCVLQCVGM